LISAGEVGRYLAWFTKGRGKRSRSKRGHCLRKEGRGASFVSKGGEKKKKKKKKSAIQTQKGRRVFIAAGGGKYEGSIFKKGGERYASSCGERKSERRFPWHMGSGCFLIERGGLRGGRSLFVGKKMGFAIYSLEG